MVAANPVSLRSRVLVRPMDQGSQSVASEAASRFLLEPSAKSGDHDTDDHIACSLDSTTSMQSTPTSVAASFEGRASSRSATSWADSMRKRSFTRNQLETITSSEIYLPPSSQREWDELYGFVQGRENSVECAIFRKVQGFNDQLGCVFHEGHFDKLKALDISRTSISDAFMADLASNNALRNNLEVLAFGGCRNVSIRSLILFFAREWPSLTKLSLAEFCFEGASDSHIDTIVEHLDQEGSVARSLKKLSLARAQGLTPDNLARLLSAPWHNLKELDLRGLTLNEACVAALNADPLRAQLEVLNLSDVQLIGGAKLSALLKDRPSSQWIKLPEEARRNV